MKTIVNGLLQSRITRWACLATLLTAPPSHAASIVQFPVPSCTVTKGIGRLEIPVRRQNDIDTVVTEDPGPVRNVQIWASLNGCHDPVVEAAPSLDVTTQVPGTDTTVLRYTRCPPGGAVELWTVDRGDHYIFWENLAPHFLEYLVDWLLAHPKP